MLGAQGSVVAALHGQPHDAQPLLHGPAHQGRQRPGHFASQLPQLPSLPDECVYMLLCRRSLHVGCVAPETLAGAMTRKLLLGPGHLTADDYSVHAHVFGSFCLFGDNHQPAISMPAVHCSTANGHPAGITVYCHMGSSSG